MGYFPKARHSQNDSENDDGRATGLGRAGRNDGGAAAASMGNRLGIAPARLRGRRRRYARTSPDRERGPESSVQRHSSRGPSEGGARVETNTSEGRRAGLV